jgi:hypothetical protein
VLLGGGDPGYMEAREISRQYRIPVTTSAHAQMHIAGFGQQVLHRRHLRIAQHADVPPGGAVPHDRTLRLDPQRQLPLPTPNHPNDRPIQVERDRAIQSGTSDMLEAAVKESIAAIERMAPTRSCSAARPRSGCSRCCRSGCSRSAGTCRCWKGARAAIEVAKMLVDLGVDASGLAFPASGRQVAAAQVF